MALDGANFISELSITDPPGTDPLSEGDDQIRTSKRTQFNSFEFVDKAVLKTADQLNDGAQRSEVNVFSAANTFSLQTVFSAGTLNSDGTAALPSYSFSNNVDMGMFRVSADVLGLAVFGVERLQILNNGIRASFDGDANRPAWSWVADPDTGLFRPADNSIGFSTSGVQRMSITNTLISSVPAFEAQGALNLPTDTNITHNMTWLRAGDNRWQLRMANDATNNDFQIRRHNNAGTFIANSLQIQRSDGQWIFNLADIPTVDPGIPGALFRSLANFLQVSV